MEAPIPILFALLAFVVIFVSSPVRADTRGTWYATGTIPSVLIGDGYPVSFYRVCFAKGNPVKLRYVLENDKVRELEMRLEGNCVDLKAKRIDVHVPGGEGMAASGSYTHIPAR